MIKLPKQSKNRPKVLCDKIFFSRQIKQYKFIFRFAKTLAVSMRFFQTLCIFFKGFRILLKGVPIVFKGFREV